MLSIKQIKLCLALSFLAVPLFVFILSSSSSAIKAPAPGNNFGIFLNDLLPPSATPETTYAFYIETPPDTGSSGGW